MPNIKVLFWNIENFGNITVYRGFNQQERCGFIAQVALLAEADIICIQEVKSAAVNLGLLNRLLRALCELPPPFNNWYYEHIKGAISTGAGLVPPYSTRDKLMYDAAHHEGYAIYWNQNFAKFKMLAADPVTDPGGAGPVPNTQGELVRGWGMPVAFGFNLPLYGMALPAAGLVVPADPAYIIPAGTTHGGAGIFAGQASPLPMALNINGGQVIPAGTTIGATVLPTGQTTGVTFNNAPFWNVQPTIIPAGFILTVPYMLPVTGTVMTPTNCLNLVLTGRDTTAAINYVGDISDYTPAFNPAGLNPWGYLHFTRGAGHPASLRGPRRPAYATIDVNRMGGLAAAQRLVPIHMYHAPSAGPASTSGMQRAAYSRSMYQVYDPGAGAWINSNFAILGGDFNVRNGATAYPYEAFTNTLANGGADCQIRANHPTPVGGAIPGDNPRNKSIVRIRNGIGGGPAILTANQSDYRTKAVDNIFYRGFAAAAVPPAVGAPPAVAVPAPNPPDQIYNLLDAVTNNAGGFNIPLATIQAFLNTVFFQEHWGVIGGGPVPVGGLQPLPNLQNINSFLTDLNGGFLGSAAGAPPTSQRKAAEFVKLCISDHLPVIFEMNL